MEATVRTVAAFALAIVVVANAGCSSESSSSATASSTPSSSVDEGAALMQVSRDWAKTAESRDVERIVSYWSDDAVVIIPDQPPVVGKAALRAMVERDMKDPRFTITWEPERASISQAGDMGYLIEHNRVTFPDPSGRVRTVSGRVVTTWKKDASGNWKCVADIANYGPGGERVLPAG